MSECFHFLFRKPEVVTYFYQHALSMTCGAAIVLGTAVMFTIYKQLNPEPEPRTVNGIFFWITLFISFWLLDYENQLKLWFDIKL